MLLLDLSMPGGSSIGAIPALLEASPGAAIVISTMHSRAAFAHEALRAEGRAGRAQGGGRQLVAAVQAALVGHLYVDPPLGAAIAVEREDAPPTSDKLSDRELEVLKLPALGHTNTEIADKFVISTRHRRIAPFASAARAWPSFSL